MDSILIWVQPAVLILMAGIAWGINKNQVQNQNKKNIELERRIEKLDNATADAIKELRATRESDLRLQEQRDIRRDEKIDGIRDLVNQVLININKHG